MTVQMGPVRAAVTPDKQLIVWRAGRTAPGEGTGQERTEGMDTGTWNRQEPLERNAYIAQAGMSTRAEILVDAYHLSSKRARLRRRGRGAGRRGGL